MNTNILNAVIDNINVNKENLKLLIKCIDEKYQESALEILLGSHSAMGENLPKTKDLRKCNSATLKYIDDAELISTNLLENTVEYRYKCRNIPCRWYKTQEDFNNNSDDYKHYKGYDYNVQILLEDQAEEKESTGTMSIKEWLDI